MLAAAMAGCAKDAQQGPASAADGEPMRIDLEKTSFMVPQGFRDVTNYSFKSPPAEIRELLAVMYEPLPKDVKTLDQLMESRRQRLGVAGDGRLKLEDVKPATLAGLEARQTSYTFEDAGE